ncbi:hypothetical protein [Spiroplasma turonicum]|uniref:Uncharacterized protein n=1 Tax=Spiroplasma turonicum TaxID=216946 RepID=A0A0K1P5A3_9MOLU|nr:hypothetical protein [Spiroplasma turonicum]AKU79470.1 hypothetical protein STURON_00224 [Spiroplasma turonicum]ALX70492.1 hypothetical protein STURO_v1c02230 [Spiroplasma turonicum]
MDSNKKDFSQYKPKNPNDPKMPTLGDEKVEKPVTNDFVNNNSSNYSNTNTSTSEPFFNNSKALGILNSLKKNLEQKDEKDEKNESRLVLPDPESELNIVNQLRNRGSIKNRALQQNTKDKIKTLREDHRLHLKEQEIELIKSTFKEKVIKVNRNSIVLKNSKFGFEIYKNNVDKRYWVVAICFEELFNPQKITYTNLWTGGAFIGYGYDDLDLTLNKTLNLFKTGRTGNIYWKDFVVDWSKETNRFITDEEPKKFTYTEYKKIIDWYSKNKIRICVKNKNKKDYEDLMFEVKQKRANGEFVSPMVALQAKMIDKPRKASYIFGYPVLNPNYKGKDFVKPENKLYEIGFAFTE